ncbi:MAG: hypothetical protein LC781_04385 [Actinobacteria bacterium]|nr:hypothetical protein [Actinomycetota bacterium]
MDEQEKRETAEAEKQYTDTMEASKQAGVKRREEAEQQRAEEEAEQQANKAAEQFADAVKASYQAVANRGVEAQQGNAKLMQQFLNSVINNLRTQAEDNRQMTQELAGQQRRAQEAGQLLMQESVSVYVDFVNSMFSTYPGSGAAEGSIREDERSTGETEGDVREEVRSIIRESIRRSEEG